MYKMQEDSNSFFFKMEGDTCHMNTIVVTAAS